VKHLYACNIKEAANGGWRRACGEARKTFELITQRSVEENGENKAQEIAEKKAALKIGEA